MTFAQAKTECTLPDCDQAKAFFSRFQKAIEANQRQEIVAMLRYPLSSAYPDANGTVFKTKSQLLAEYDTVFTPGVQCAIQAATLSDVKSDVCTFVAGLGISQSHHIRARADRDSPPVPPFVEVSVWRL
jgi:hypothetical protein